MFLLKTGKEVSGKITIAVKEYYSISDILLGRLSTTSNGKLLETGGMLHITATTVNNEKCDLKKGKALEIAFPRKTPKEGMQLFTGDWKNNQINWIIDQKSINLDQTFSQVDQKPEYPGGVQKMYKFIGTNFRNQEDGISGKIYASFVINKEGIVTDIRITKGISKATSEETIRVLKLLPKFTPGKINGIAVNTSYLLPITIRSDYEYDESSANNKPYIPNYTEKTFQEAGSSEIGDYFFSATKLGFINCDRFINYPDNQKIDYVLNINEDSDTSIYVIFHRFKSVLKGFPDSDHVVFRNVLSKEKITIVAIKYFNQKPFLAIEETMTNTKLKNGLAFHPVTLEGIKKEMLKLNVLN